MAQSGFERFVFSSAGYKAILKSSGVESDLGARAQRVKSAAQSRVPAGVELFADTNLGRVRAGATVGGVPMRIEADRRILGGAIDAAR